MNNMADSMNNPAKSNFLKNHFKPTVNPLSKNLDLTPGFLLADHSIKSIGYGASRPKGSPAWLIMYTMSGDGAIRVNNVERTCGVNEIAILKPGTPHQYYTSGASDWNFYWAYFMPRFQVSHWTVFPEQLQGLSVLFIEKPEVRKRLVLAFERMIDDIQQFNPIQDELSLSALGEIILLINREFMKQTTHRMDARVQEIWDILHQDYRQQQTLDDLAKRVCLSPSRLSHLFKEQTGVSVIDTLSQIRLRQGTRLLHFSTMGIGEIAEEIGFQSYHYFTRQFTAFYGISPTRYRERSQR